MKRSYVKPVVLANEELTEGIYMASGDGCLVTTATRGQETAGENKVIYGIYMVHTASHHNGGQTIVAVFNQNITSAYCQGVNCVASGNTVTITRDNHMEEIGNATMNLEVWGADSMPTLLSVSASDSNHPCNQHTTE